ncbi:MAG: hypothetical protein AAFX44_00920 [Pseudomonadota bacterium]
MNVKQTLGAVATAISVVATLLVAQPAGADEILSFVRIDKDGQRNDRALQVAVKRYRQNGAHTATFVDLVGVVHVGDADYYSELNASFRQYDALLYELVAPADHDTRLDKRNESMIGGAQIAMKDAMGLEFQLHHIDYTADNFVHADLSPQALRRSMEERGESLYVYFWRAFYAGMADYAKDPLGIRSWQLLGAMVAPDDGESLKRAFARELIRSDAMLDALGGEDGSALIQARNERAMQVFDDEWSAGSRRVGIFYGAAHMPDFEERLRERGFEPVDTRWLDAWLFEQDE